MSVLARFASSPLRSRDPSVRLRAVQKHLAEDTAPLAELARSDPDARVRREAVRRLEAPRVLLELQETAGDEQARRLARSRAESLLVKIASDDRDLEESRRALGLLAPLRAVAEVVCRARFEAVRTEAFGRITKPAATAAADAAGNGSADRETALARVAARGANPALRGEALRAIGSAAALAQVAVTAGGRETGAAAVRRLTDPDDLLRVAESGAARGVRRLARRLAEERLPPDHPNRVENRERELDALWSRPGGTPAEQARRLAEAEALVAAGPVGEAALARLEAARRQVQEAAAADVRRLRLPGESAVSGAADPGFPAPVPQPSLEVPVPAEVEELLLRLEDPEAELSLDAVEEAERQALAGLAGVPPDAAVHLRFRTALRGARDRAHARRRRRVDAFELAELAAHAAALVESLAKGTGDAGGAKRSWADPARAQRELSRLERRFARSSLQESEDGIRFREAAEKAGTLLTAARAQQQEKKEKTEARIARLDERLASLETASPLPLEEAENALRDLGALRAAKEVWRTAGPTQQARFQRLQAALMPRLREARELLEWKRWSNVDAQTEIIRLGKALLDEENSGRVDRELTKLDRRWHDARHADRERGQELWEEWGTVRASLLERAAPAREARSREQAERIASLEVLAARAEALAEEPDAQTADEMRGLMPEWKARSKGLPRRKADAVWKRFRAANDRYFGALAERRAERKKRLQDLIANIPAREELVARAEALAQEADPGNVGEAVRGLIAEWKEAPPVPRRAQDRLWEAFGAALDRAREAARERRHAGRDGSAARGDAGPEAPEVARLDERVAGIGALPAAERVEAAAPVFAELRRLLRGRTGAGNQRTGGSPALVGVEGRLTAALQEAFEAAPASFVGTRFDQGELVRRLQALGKELAGLRTPGTGGAPRSGGAVSLAEHLQRSLGAGRAADRDAEAREAGQRAERLLERVRAAGPALSGEARAGRADLEKRARKIIRAAPPPPEVRERKRFRARPERGGWRGDRRRERPRAPGAGAAAGRA